MAIQSQPQSSSRYQMQRGVGHWRPTLLFVLLPTLVGLALLFYGRAPVQAQTPSPTIAVEQVTPPTTLPAASFGRESFAQNCAPCHGDNGLGDGPTAASLRRLNSSPSENMSRMTPSKRTGSKAISPSQESSPRRRGAGDWS